MYTELNSNSKLYLQDAFLAISSILIYKPKLSLLKVFWVTCSPWKNDFFSKYCSIHTRLDQKVLGIFFRGVTIYSTLSTSKYPPNEREHFHDGTPFHYCVKVLASSKASKKNSHLGQMLYPTDGQASLNILNNW